MRREEEDLTPRGIDNAADLEILERVTRAFVSRDFSTICDRDITKAAGMLSRARHPLAVYRDVLEDHACVSENRPPLHRDMNDRQLRVWMIAQEREAEWRLIEEVRRAKA